MVFQKELHPLTVWRGELHALITNLMQPQFPSVVDYIFAVIIFYVIGDDSRMVPVSHGALVVSDNSSCTLPPTVASGHTQPWVTQPVG